MIVYDENNIMCCITEENMNELIVRSGYYDAKHKKEYIFPNALDYVMENVLLYHFWVINMSVSIIQ